jgi:hypothetical protein
MENQLMERVGEHPIPAGPLAVRWLAYDLPELRAGAESNLVVALRNAGTATWRVHGDHGVRLSYHWLDDRGNPIVWDGPRVDFGDPVAPRDEVEVELPVRAPQPPGRYRLAFDLVEEHRFWFAEVGSHPLELDVEVRPRIDERRLAVVVDGDMSGETAAALAAQEEPVVEDDAVAFAYLVPRAVPAPDWSRRVLDAHAEGFVAVGGSIETRDRSLKLWAPGGGRNPGFWEPLLLPSLLRGTEIDMWNGLPAYVPDDDEPWIFDGRIRLRLPRDHRRG